MRRRCLATALLPVLIAACSGSTPSDPSLSPTASEVLHRIDDALGEQAPLDPDQAVVPEGCRLVIETDEYNFETEVVVCDEDPTTTTTTSGTQVGSTDSTTTTTTIVLVEPADLEGWGGSEDAREIARRLRRVVVEQTECDTQRDLIALENLATAIPLEIKESFLAALQDLRRSAESCNVDDAGWRRALEDALDDLEQMLAVLRESSDG